MTCPDCKDGFYYPFAGPREPCQTCTPVAPAKEVAQIFKNADFVDNRNSADEILAAPTLEYEKWADAHYGEMWLPASEIQSKGHCHQPGVAKSTDWSKWYPKDARRKFLATMFDFHPVVLEMQDIWLDSLLQEVIGGFFRTQSTNTIVQFFRDRRSVTLFDIAKVLVGPAGVKALITG